MPAYLPVQLPLLLRFACVAATSFFCVFTASVTLAQDWVWAPELKVGTALPPIEAKDQNGVTHTVPDLLGDKGLVLVMSRSYEWCPYCIRQLGQLVEVQAQFKEMGFHVATMTYDPVDILEISSGDHEATFPMLSDADGYKNVMAMGILNAQYEPGHRAYGIPYPGIFLLDSDGIILAKFAEEDYKMRPDFSLVLEEAAKH